MRRFVISVLSLWLCLILIGCSFPTTATPADTTPATSIPATTTQPTQTTESAPIVQQEQLVAYALELINNDRIDNGLNTVILGSNTAAQEHAEEMLVIDYMSHWGADGMKPYMRYTLAGGFNYEAENAFFHRTIWYGEQNPSYRLDPIEVLEKAEKGLMNSAGHRRNILNKQHKKVNIGIAYDNERLTLVQQFEGDYITFNKYPGFSGSTLSLSGNTITGFVIDQIQIWYDQPPHPLTLGQLGMTYAYSLGTPVVFIRPPPPPGSYYPDSDTFYSWTTYIDPYTVPPDTPAPTYSLSIKPVPPPLSAIVAVEWIDAERWDISGTSFNIDANLSEILSQFGKGVYTVAIWAKTGNEHVELSNYSVFIE